MVLASRKPNVCHTVLDYISRKGAKVIPMAVDISDVNHLRAAYADIKANMPPIGGIMNAAMVLRDRIFNRLIWEDFFATLAPKVAGTKNLDEVFGNEQLDFFICFSSTTSVVGSIGQSAYGAANQYMASLIAQRRQRGLAGSVLHIAILAGIGYISRQDSEHTDTIYKAISPRLNTQSETDLHEMLAESIVCGRPGSGHTGELITGIKPVFQGEWRDDPRLYAYSSQEQLQESDNRQQTHRHISVKDQLATIEDVSGCLNVVETSFTHALGNLLELDPKNLDKMMPVASLGIDSLVAIRIREWFLKEMDVDVPVIDIMSDNYSISRICSDAFTTWKNNKNA